jgi:hypothetical protein
MDSMPRSRDPETSLKEWSKKESDGDTFRHNEPDASPQKIAGNWRSGNLCAAL